VATEQPASVTRGFLFADLRGYTDFVEQRGASAAADLLTRYRALARDAISRFGGAEIKTEGDSFYVVFNSVSSAVRCGLAITTDATAASVEQPQAPIRVGIGIHAGETVESEGGYVGSPVNIAARICAQAAANEVLVSETVRALTLSLLPVRFRSRGRRTLKGIAEPIELFAVTEAAEGAAAWPAPRRRRRVSRRRAVLLTGVTMALVAAAVVAWLVIRPPAVLPPGPWTIGLDMPMRGPFADSGTQVRNAVQLAIDEANEADLLGGVELVVETYDDSGETGDQLPDPARGAENATKMVKDPRTIAMIGPYVTPVAFKTVPITNEAGLLQCSPSVTDPSLTKPEFGALEVRAGNPERVNFVRLAPSDDAQIRGLAAFATHEIDAESALVIDAGEETILYADSFNDAFTGLGGRTIRASYLLPATPASVLEPLAGDGGLDVVVFIGDVSHGAAALRQAMVDEGFGSTPFLGLDFILDGSGADKGSYIQKAGAAAAETYASHSSIAPPRASFVDAYRAAYGKEPDDYAPAAYACAQVIIQALQALGATSPSADGLREALRARVVDPAHRYETVLGTLGFDANGDSTQQFVSVYRVDLEEAGGAGDWVVIQQRDYGPGS
jgi:branched-chain amino acid transport system substrate-binding protein